MAALLRAGWFVSVGAFAADPCDLNALHVMVALLPVAIVAEGVIAPAALLTWYCARPFEAKAAPPVNPAPAVNVALPVPLRAEQ
jgi:hypothetical protein